MTAPTCTVVEDGAPVKVLGTTQDFEGCECCGRMNLRTYVVIEHESGVARHYGTSCAATIMGYDTDTMRTRAKQAEFRRSATPEQKAAAARRSNAYADRLAFLERMDRNAERRRVAGR